ncbi:MAG: MgtC/SapB family protein [Gemmatimonadales bacterium]
MEELDLAVRLAVAALAGLAVGVEREWSGHATGPLARFAGVRTFFLLGSISGIAGWLLDSAESAVAAALLIAAGALVVAAYVLAARRSPDAIDGTTETAAILVLGIGLLAGVGHLRLASGLAAVTVLALGEKETIRGFVSRIGQSEMRAALYFAVLALVILPLLPPGPIGPEWLDFRPRALWIVVLIFSGLNFIGYIARKAVGAAHGYQIIGALGGFISSTVVTLNFSRQSRKEPGNAVPLAIGTVAACTVLIPRILAVTLILNATLVSQAALGLAPIFVAGAVLILIAWRSLRGGEPKSEPPEPRNPLQLRSAIQMVIAFQAVLTLLTLITRQFGEPGVLVSAAVLGISDMDALTFGMNRLGEAPELLNLAARAITLGVIVNSVFKGVLALTLGNSRYRLLVGLALLAQAVAGAIGFWLLSF